jgi:hypothetical protein
MDSASLAINLLGFVATASSILLWLPQARITWRNRNDAARLAGISSSTQWLVVISGLFWIAYGLLADSFWVMAPCLISVPLGLATVVVVRRGRRLPPPTISVPIIDSEVVDGGFLDTSFLDTTEIAAESTQTSSVAIMDSSADVGTTGHLAESISTGAVPIIDSSESLDGAFLESAFLDGADSAERTPTGAVPIIVSVESAEVSVPTPVVTSSAHSATGPVAVLS